MGGDEAALHQIAALNEALRLAVSLLAWLSARLDQSRRGGPFVHLLCEVGRCAECTAHAAARLKASGMAITARTKATIELWRFVKSLS
jgi:hypothetical protein